MVSCHESTNGEGADVHKLQEIGKGVRKKGR